MPRDRPAEFTATGPVADLAAATDRLREACAGWVEAQRPRRAGPPAPTAARRRMPRQGEVLLHVYEELAQHRGQMEVTRDVVRAAAG